MDMITVHKEALESTNIPYNDFLLFYRLGQKMVYGFIEGKDDPSFYRNFIENVLPDGWTCKLIQAGNKSKVLALFAAIDWTRFPRKSVCFFIDRDLSEFLGGEKYEGENLFISDHYSIENELLTENMLERVLDEICCVGRLEPQELDKLKQIYRNNVSLFKESMACVMAQIILWRRAQQEDNKLIIRLDKIKVNTFFAFTSGAASLRPEFVTTGSRVQHSGVCVNAAVSAGTDLTAAEGEFRSKNGCEKFVRGKYLLAFFLQCVESLRQAIPGLFPRHRQAPGTNGGMGAGNAVMIIGPRAKCPQSLRTFLSRNYEEFVRAAAGTT